MTEPPPQPRDPVDALFVATYRLDPAERKSLEESCRGQPELRAEVEELLRAHDASAGDLETALLAGEGAEAADRVLHAGPFVLGEVLGEGGMGVVYRAEQLEPVRREVAVKLIRSGMDSRVFLKRFETERQALAMMQHDCIAKVVDAGSTEDGRPYFAMELVEGESIVDYCARTDMPLRDRIRLLVQVCQGVQHAHSKGILHRDLKPSNVLVVEQSGRATPKIIDFGLARAVEAEQPLASIATEHGRLMGTPEYMSPEQARGEIHDIDTRADIYALGVLAYELVTGQLPFSSEELRSANLTEMLRKICEDDPPRPSTRVASSKGLRGDLDWIVMKALEKERTRRYATVDAFARDLLRFLDGHPVEARAPTASYLVSKYLRRHAGLVASLAAIFVAVAVGAIVATVLYFEAERGRREARVAEREANGLRLAAEATVIARRDPTTSLLIGLEASRLADDRSIRTALYDALVHHRELAVLDSHGYDIFDVDIHVNGRLAVSVGREVAILWDLEAKAELHRLSRASQHVDFSPDGARIVSGGTDGAARIWDVATGKCVGELPGHEGVVRWAEFSPDGTLVVTACRDRLARIFDARTGVLRHALGPHGDQLYRARFSPSGDRIVTLGWDHRARVFRVADGALVGTFEAGSLTARTLAEGAPQESELLFLGMRAEFTADGRMLWVSSPASEVGGVWYLADGKRIVEFRAGQIAGIVGNEIHAVVRHGRAWEWRVFDMARREVVRRFAIDALPRLLQVSRDGRIGASTTGTNEITILDLEQGRQSERLGGHQYAALSLEFHPQRSRLISSAKDGTVRVWDLDSPLRGRRCGRGELSEFCLHSPVVEAAIGVFVEPQDAGQSRWSLWDLGHNRELFAIDELGSPVVRATPAPDGRSVVAVHRNRRVRIWDIARREVVSAFRSTGSPRVAVAPSGTKAAFYRRSSQGRAVVVHALPSGKPATRVGPKTGAIAVAWSPGGNRLAIVSYDEPRCVRIYQAADSTKLVELRGHLAWVVGVAFSPDGKRIATVANDTRVRVWDTATGESLAVFTAVPTLLDGEVGWTRDGRILWARTDQQLVLIAPDSEEILGRAKTPGRRFEKGRLSRDENWLVTMSVDGVLVRWPLDPISFAKQRVPRALREDEIVRYRVDRSR